MENSQSVIKHHPRTVTSPDGTVYDTRTGAGTAPQEPTTGTVEEAIANHRNSNLGKAILSALFGQRTEN